jgi:regulation of enolase protein 1 (concanavalin A-like superfamily)
MTDTPLHTNFSDSTLNSRLQWHCEPADWQLDPATPGLRLKTEAHTDFWQRTHYGFQADNGHFLHLEARGDFVLTTKVTSRALHQYDQAGLMVRVSEGCWLKTSVEFEPDGDNRLGAVVTNGHYSDWSTQPLPKQMDTVWFRIRAEAADCIVESSFDGDHWVQIRMAHLHDRAAVELVTCGLYACSPKASGYEAEFSLLSFTPGRISKDSE